MNCRAIGRFSGSSLTAILVFGFATARSFHAKAALLASGSAPLSDDPRVSTLVLFGIVGLAAAAAAVAVRMVRRSH